MMHKGCKFRSFKRRLYKHLRFRSKLRETRHFYRSPSCVQTTLFIQVHSSLRHVNKVRSTKRLSKEHSRSLNLQSLLPYNGQQYCTPKVKKPLFKKVQRDIQRQVFCFVFTASGLELISFYKLWPGAGFLNVI